VILETMLYVFSLPILFFLSKKALRLQITKTMIYIWALELLCWLAISIHSMYFHFHLLIACATSHGYELQGPMQHLFELINKNLASLFLIQLASFFISIFYLRNRALALSKLLLISSSLILIFVTAKYL
jgi:hypothetical protein